MTSVGAALRHERQAQGRTIEEIAAELCLMPSYLRAIESDDVARLPGVFFYKCFVRQYATLLGMDAAKLQTSIDVLTAVADVEPAVNEKPIRVPDPIAEAANRLHVSDRNWLMPVAALLLAILGGAGIYAWYKRPAPAAVSEVVPVVANVADTGSDQPIVNVTTTTDANGVRRLELNLSARETTWLSITSDGKQIFSGTLYPDQTKTLSGLEVARLKVGNAGGLNVQWNGKEVGPLGESGQVKVVVFTPEGFSILPNAEEAASSAETL
ncbi:MAG: hypothetical protein RL328_959 [Acidobacteriota bacterium]|jgi:cytoskeleton protein RodZ